MVCFFFTMGVGSFLRITVRRTCSGSERTSYIPLAPVLGRILNLTDSIGQHACLFACMGATYSMLDTCGGSNRYLIVARTCAWIIGPNDQKCAFAKALGVVDVHLYHVRGERI